MLEVDGLHAHWERGVASDYEGELGHHGERAVADYLPEHLRTQLFDTSGMGVGNDIDRETSANNTGHKQATHLRTTAVNDIDVVYTVRELDPEFFRKNLVEHFDIMYKRNQIVWPSRTGLPPPASVSVPSSIM